MPRILEDFRAYEESRIWTLQHLYYENVGGRAWSSQAIPSVATTNPVLVRQHAQVLLALVAELVRSGVLGTTDEVRVLEVGSGSGAFAERLLRSLATECGPEGSALLGRLTYVFSDFAPTALNEALAREPLATLKRGGYLIPALFDLTKPEQLTSLAGEPITGSFVAAYANYVACTLPQIFLRKTPTGPTQRLVRINLRTQNDDDLRTAEQIWSDLLADPERPALMEAIHLVSDWRPIGLAQAFADPVHEAAFTRATDRFATATVGYPLAFLDFTRHLKTRMVKGGALFITDFGHTLDVELEGLREPTPSIYGSTLNHAIDFSVLESFCKVTGIDIVRTRNPFANVARAAIIYGGDSHSGLPNAFRRWHGTHDRAHEYLQLIAAGEAFDAAQSHHYAARSYHRLTHLEPRSAEWHFRLARACQRKGWIGLAIRYLRRGRRLPGAEKWDFDFVLGLCYMRLDRLLDARRAFRRSLKHDRHGTTYSNLGSVHARLGDVARARACYGKSLALIPTGPAADEVRANLQALAQLPP
jgi:hypothetical protein